MSDVRLRPVIDDDLPRLYEQQRDREALEMAAVSSRDRASFDAHWKKVLADDANVIRAIVFDGQLAGYVTSFERGGKRLVGYWIGRAFWGKGIASRALATFIRYEDTRPLRAHVAKHNVASLRVLEKCGFAMIGEGRIPDGECGVEGTEELILSKGDRSIFRREK